MYSLQLDLANGYGRCKTIEISRKYVVILVGSKRIKAKLRAGT